MPCDCPNARANRVLGHLWVRCRADGCTSIWYRPRHDRGRLARPPEPGYPADRAAVISWSGGSQPSCFHKMAPDAEVSTNHGWSWTP